MSNSPVPMGRFKPALWAAAIVFVCLSLLRAVVRPSEPEPYESARPFTDPKLWVAVDFATGQEVRRFDNVSNANTWEVTWLVGVLVLPKVVFMLECLGLAVLYAIGLATWMVAVVVLFPRIDWSMVFGVAVGVLGWVCKWVASVMYVVATELGRYLARVVRNPTAGKGDLARELIQASKDFLAPKRVLDKICEWVTSVKNAGFERLNSFLDWMGESLGWVKKYLIAKPIGIGGRWLVLLEEHIPFRKGRASPPHDHKTPVQPETVTGEEDYEDHGTWMDYFRPTIRLGLPLASPLAREVVQEMADPELEWTIFKGRPYCRQTIFTANSSKDIEGLPPYDYPERPLSFYIALIKKLYDSAVADIPRIRLNKYYPLTRTRYHRAISIPDSGLEFYISWANRLHAQGYVAIPRVLSIKNYLVTRTPCRRVLVIPRSRRRLRRVTGSAPQAMQPVPDLAVDETVLEVRGESGVLSLCDGKSADVPVIVEEARSCIEPIVVERKEEYRSLEFRQKEGAVQMGDRQAIALNYELVLEANLQAVDLAIKPLGDVPGVEVNIADSCNVPASVEEAQVSFKPAIAEEAGGAIKPTVVEGEERHKPQVPLQKEVEVEREDGPAPTLAHEPALGAISWEADLITEPLSEVAKAGVDVVGFCNVPATVEEPQMSLGHTVAGGAGPASNFATPGMSEEHHLRVLQREEAVQQAEPLAIPFDHEPVPEANLDDLWANLLEAGLATEPSGDDPRMDVDTTDPWGGHATVGEAQASLVPTISAEARAAIKSTVVEGPEQCHSQFLRQGKVVQQGGPQAMSLNYKSVLEADLGDPWGKLPAAGLVREPLRDAPMVDVSATGPWGQPATVEEAQASLEPTITEEARAATNHTVPVGPGERHPQEFFQQGEAIQQVDPLAIARTQETVFEANVNQLWANLPSEAPVTEPSRDTPMLDVNAVDPWGVPATVKEDQASVAPTVTEASGQRHPQAFFQQEVIHQAVPLAIALDRESVSGTDLNHLWENVRATGLIVQQSVNAPSVPTSALDSAVSQRRSPPCGDQIADLTQHTAPGFRNDGLAPGAPMLGGRESVPTSPLPVAAKTEGGPVVFGGMVVPSSLFGDGYQTGQEVNSPTTNTIDFTPPVQQKVGAPMCDGFVAGSSSVGPSGDNGGQVYFTKRGEESLDSDSDLDSDTDEDERIYWAASMPKELRTHHGRYLAIPWIEPPEASKLVLEDSDSGLLELLNSELDELYGEEGESKEEAKEDKKGTNEDEDEVDYEGYSDEEVGIGLPTNMSIHSSTPDYRRVNFVDVEGGRGVSDSDEIKWADSMPAHFRDPGYGRVTVPRKEKVAEGSSEEISSNKWAASMLPQRAGSGSIGNGIPGEEEDDDEEQSGRFDYRFEYDTDEDEYEEAYRDEEEDEEEVGYEDEDEDEDEDEGEDEDGGEDADEGKYNGETEWESYMPVGPGFSKHATAKKGVGRGVDLSEFLIAAGDLEEEEYQREREKERRLDEMRKWVASGEGRRSRKRDLGEFRSD